jgi:hypothetical protein
MHRGYVKLWRKSLDSGLLQNADAWQLMTWCLLKASHKPHRQLVGTQVVELQVGQLVFGRKAAAKELNTTERKIRTSLELLKKLDFLTIKATNKYSIITIVNWDTYQSERPTNDQQQGQQATSKRPASDQQTTTNKNEKNYKNGENEKKYPPELVEFVTAFQNHVSATLGAMAPKATESSTNTACQVLRLMTEKDGWTLDQIREVLRWALEDDFWSTNARSITGLRKRSKSNGLTKFQNMYAAWEKQRGAHARASNPDYAWLNDPNDINHFL